MIFLVVTSQYATLAPATTMVVYVGSFANISVSVYLQFLVLRFVLELCAQLAAEIFRVELIGMFRLVTLTFL